MKYGIYFTFIVGIRTGGHQLYAKFTFIVGLRTGRVNLEKQHAIVFNLIHVGEVT